MELRAISTHAYACLQPDRGLGWSNSGFVNAGGGLVIDTLMDLPRTRRMLELYAGVSPAPPQRLVNTHHNSDHCWGNQLLGDAEIIGHRECAARMQRDLPPEALQALASQATLPPGARWLAEQLAAFDFSGIRVTPPTTLLDGDAELDLGALRAQVLYVGPAHTAGDVIVHLPDEGVVYAGDVVFRLCTPIGWEGTCDRWVAALARIEALNPSVVVPGHGPLCDADGVRELREYFEYVHAEARRFYDQGLPALEAAKKIELGPYAGWSQPERLIFNVERSFREFRGGPWDEPLDFPRLVEGAIELGRSWRGEP